jgi:hypothetical protein
MKKIAGACAFWLFFPSTGMANSSDGMPPETINSVITIVDAAQDAVACG